MTRTISLAALAVAGLFAFGSRDSTAVAEPLTFLGLGSSTQIVGTGNAMSRDGSTAVGVLGGQAFSWSLSGGMSLLGAGAAYGVSGDGSVVVGASGGNAVAWSGGATTVLGSGAAHAVSADGAMIAGAQGTSAVRWSEGGMENLGSVGGSPNIAWDMSDDGSVVIGRATDGPAVAFRWTEPGGMQGLGNIVATSAGSLSLGVSGDGTHVVGRGRDADHNNEAFMWDDDGMLGLGQLGGMGSVAYDVSDDGSLVVGSATLADNSQTAFIWDAKNGMRSLADVLANDFGFDLTGWVLTDARAISADGKFLTGNGIHDGVMEAWVADPDFVAAPEPATAALLGFGVFAMGWVKRRRA